MHPLLLQISFALPEVCVLIRSLCSNHHSPVLCYHSKAMLHREIDVSCSGFVTCVLRMDPATAAQAPTTVRATVLMPGAGWTHLWNDGLGTSSRAAATRKVNSGFTWLSFAILQDKGMLSECLSDVPNLKPEQALSLVLCMDLL